MADASRDRDGDRFTRRGEIDAAEEGGLTRARMRRSDEMHECFAAVDRGAERTAIEGIADDDPAA